MLFESSGILASWTDNQKRYFISLGRHKARQSLISQKNNTNAKDGEQDSIFTLLVQLIFVGIGISLGAFFIELVMKVRFSPMWDYIFGFERTSIVLG